MTEENSVETLIIIFLFGFLILIIPTRNLLCSVSFVLLVVTAEEKLHLPGFVFVTLKDEVRVECTELNTKELYNF